MVARFRLAPSLALTLALAGATACQTIESHQQPIAVTARVHSGQPVRAWEVATAEGQRIGLLVRFEPSQQGATHYMVRNVWHQDLGLIDAHGRAYRFVPHSTDPAWVGSSDVLTGVERILEREDCRLFEIPFQELEHARTPGEQERRRSQKPPS